MRTQTQTEQVNIRLPEDLRQVLDMLKDRDGVPYSESVRRALKFWFEHRQLLPKKAGK